MFRGVRLSHGIATLGKVASGLQRCLVSASNYMDTLAGIAAAHTTNTILKDVFHFILTPSFLVPDRTFI
jgi:hypothetical protein